ncbi:MAG TPA: nucleotide exchange factor GrpE [Actinomycetota bacterium]|nr:nucleotide exchange factor GrpE [Actinomycetota bacterium]
MTHHEEEPQHDPRESADVPGGGETPRPKVRVTDRRHSARPTDDAPRDGGIGGAEGSGSEASRSEAPPGADGHAGRDAIDPRVLEAEREAAEYRDHLLRLQAEFDNFRKRTLREQSDSVERAAEPIMRRLLDVLDDFDLALMAAERTPDLEQFMRGVEIVYAKLTDILSAEGLERIDAEGKPFDPELHEALMHAEGDVDGELVVDDVFRQGYTLKGRVIRPAGVRVTRK